MSDIVRWLAPVAIVASASPTCYAVQYLTVEQARATIFADASEFIATPITLTRAQAQAIQSASGVRVRVLEQRVWQARAAGELLGWFIVDEVYGKHELITYAVGITTDGTVRQIEVMDYRENYGYEIRNPAWRRQFVGKRHGDTLKLDQDIKNISGATLSCRHVSEGVKRLLAFHQVALR
jgi:Na+-translocating ferredoxin:NAD+ oxidoreductase RnfG subunit